MHLAPGYWAGHMRIYHRECLALAGRYQVELAGHLSGEDRLDPRIRVHCISRYTKPTLSWRLLSRLRRSRWVYSLARKSQAQLFHYYSPEFIPWARRLRKATQRPIIFDCMEDFEGYVRQRRGIPDPLRPILAFLMRRQLQSAARNSDAVIVADAGTALLLQPYARRLLVLHNYPRLDLFEPHGGEDGSRPYDVVYHGSIPRYHLEVCLAVDEHLVRRGVHLQWRLIGSLPEIDWFLAALEQRGTRDRFHISGLVPHDRVASEVRKAKIGIIPLPDLPKFRHNIPQKLFEFMALGMPVVLSDLPPSRPFIGRDQCGILVPPQDYSGYAEAIIRLLQDPGLRREMGREGRRRVEQEYNWEQESRKLLDLYSEVLSG